MPSRVLAELRAVLVPPACLVCRSALPRAELWLCAGCTRALPWLPARRCARCALASHRRGCPAAGAAFTRAWAPLAHDGVARELVAALKFRGALPVAALMAAHMAANLPADLRAAVSPAAAEPVSPTASPAADSTGRTSRLVDAASPAADSTGRTSRLVDGASPAADSSPAIGAASPAADSTGRTSRAVGPASPALVASQLAVALVPVPSPAARERRRGFNPAGVLAAALAPRLGLPERVCLRRRDRATRQVGSTRAQRRRSDRLAIELRAPPPDRALLVDDVHTTGATLDACARALLAGGCREVIALTYTRTL